MRLLTSTGGGGAVVARRHDVDDAVGDMGGTRTHKGTTANSNSRSRSKNSQRGGTNSRTARLNDGAYTQLVDDE